MPSAKKFFQRLRKGGGKKSNDTQPENLQPGDGQSQDQQPGNQKPDEQQPGNQQPEKLPPVDEEPPEDQQPDNQAPKGKGKGKQRDERDHSADVYLYAAVYHGTEETGPVLPVVTQAVASSTPIGCQPANGET